MYSRFMMHGQKNIKLPVLWLLSNYRGFEVIVVVTVFCWAKLTFSLIYGYEYFRGKLIMNTEVFPKHW